MNNSIKAFNNQFKNLAMVMAAMVLTTLPLSSFAANDMVTQTGVSDETLFFIMLTVAAIQLIAILVIAGVIKSIASNADIWQMRFKNKGAAALLALMALCSTPLFATEAPQFDNLIQMDNTGFMFLVIINLLLFFTLIYLTSKLNGLMRMMMKDEEGKVPETFMDQINQMLTKAVPVEREAEVETDHVYDGIRELDNRLPPWWLWGFYASIVFAFVYLILYHVSGTRPLPAQEYQAELDEAAADKAAFAATQTNAVDETNVELLTDAASLGEGEKTFKLYCSPCHGESGGSMPGGVGPNLTDDYWLHGGAITDIFKTIKYGVPAKGMVSWEAQLNPTKMQQVASYIKSLHGTNPENAKEPQGDLWQEATVETQEAVPVDSTAVESEAAI